MARRRGIDLSGMVMIDKHMIHDRDNRTCSHMRTLRWELTTGRGCYYTVVRPIQAIVFKIPGCPTCFGTEEAFRQFIRTV